MQKRTIETSENSEVAKKWMQISAEKIQSASYSGDVAKKWMQIQDGLSWKCILKMVEMRKVDAL